MVWIACPRTQTNKNRHETLKVINNMASDRHRKDTPAPGELEQRSRIWLEENKGSQSPQTHDLLVAARKGRTNDIERILSTEKGRSDAATITDRVRPR